MKKIVIVILIIILGIIGYNCSFSYEVNDVVIVDMKEENQNTIISLDLNTSARNFVSYQIEEDQGVYTICLKTSLLSSKNWPQEITIPSKKDAIKRIEVKNPRNDESKVLFDKS